MYIRKQSKITITREPRVVQGGVSLVSNRGMHDARHDYALVYIASKIVAHTI